MTVGRFRAVLREAGLDLTAREIAEALWLARHLDAPEPGPEPEAEPGPEPAAVPSGTVVPESPGTVPSVPAEPRPRRPAEPAVGDRHEIRLPAVVKSPGRGALSVDVPTAPMLADPRAIQRSLRPFKRRVPSRHRWTLDEDATARLIAERRLWAPVMAPLPERWLDLALVVDTGPSMRVWRPLVRELFAALTRLGAFRDVKVWYLTGRGVSGSPTGTPAMGPGALHDPSGRRVLLVLSDCSGDHWWTGAASRILGGWARRTPTAILQPLPERLWDRTAAPVEPGMAFAAQAMTANTALRFVPHEGPDQRPPGGIAVPVLEPDADWLGDWARLVTATGGAVPVSVAYVGGTVAKPLDEAVNGAGPEPSIEERVSRFRAAASPEAVRLAAHLAVSLPALPVMRLVQAVTLGPSSPSRLAEVILSGLLRPAPDGHPDRYEFLPGARAALLGLLPRSESWHAVDVLERVSARIEAAAGSVAETFRASLPVPEGEGDRAAADGPAIALVSREAVRLLGHTAIPTLSDGVPEAPAGGAAPVPVPVPQGDGNILDEAPQMPADLFHVMDPTASRVLLIGQEKTWVVGDPLLLLWDVLADSIGIPSSHGSMTTSSAEAPTAIRAVGADASDLLLVYVTGLIRGEGAGLSIDISNPSLSIRQEELSISDICRWMVSSPAKLKWLIIDAFNQDGTLLSGVNFRMYSDWSQTGRMYLTARTGQAFSNSVAEILGEGVRAAFEQGPEFVPIDVLRARIVEASASAVVDGEWGHGPRLALRPGRGPALDDDPGPERAVAGDLAVTIPDALHPKMSVLPGSDLPPLSRESPEAWQEWKIEGITELRELDVNALGRVALGRDDESGRIVAVKYHIYYRSDHQHARNEARALDMISSRYVPRLIRFVENHDSRMAAIVMEGIDGVPLKRLLNERVLLSPEASVAVLKDAVLGLADVHAAGLVHCDFKPANIVVGDDGRSVLIDLAIAQSIGESLPRAGTPVYMAPEQWKGMPLGPATDIYAAACTLFECLTGGRPYEGTNSIIELMNRHLDGPIPYDEVPEAFQDVIRRGMAKDPADRYQTAPEFLAAMESAVRRRRWWERLRPRDS